MRSKTAWMTLDGMGVSRQFTVDNDLRRPPWYLLGSRDVTYNGTKQAALA